MGYIKSGGFRTKEFKTEGSKDEDINLLPYLNNMAMIRELHVYGVMTPLKNNNNNNNHQHKGFGKMLIKKAEEIAMKNNYDKIGVISGVGVRKYYEKLGYKLNNNYMIKEFDYYDDTNKLAYIISILLIIYCLFMTFQVMILI